MDMNAIYAAHGGSGDAAGVQERIVYRNVGGDDK